MSPCNASLRKMTFAMREFCGPDPVLALPGNEEFGGNLVETTLGEAAEVASTTFWRRSTRRATPRAATGRRVW